MSMRSTGKKMYLIGMFWIFLCFGSPRSFVQSSDWVEDLARYAAEDTKFKVVKLMTRLAENEFIDNPAFDKLCIQLVQNVPTMRINFGEDFEPPVNSVPDETSESITPIDTSSTLFLFVIESSDGFPISTMKRFIDTVAKMSSYHYSPKYLVIYFTQKPSDSVEEVLQYAWTKNMLDFTIIELAQRRLPRRSILIEWSVASPIIHQLHPFKEMYTKEIWPSDMDKLFPNKVDDLGDKPLRVATNIAQFDFINEGPFGMLDLIFQKLNSSIENIPLNISMDMLNNKEAWRTIFDKMESNNIDLFSYKYPASGIHGWNNTHRTTAVEFSSFCALVPILHKKTFEVPIDFFLAYAVSFAIILMFWIFMRVLRYNSYSWRIFNIGRVLFGVSVSQQPRGNAERIMFTCLLLIFAVYSSTIFGCMTDIAWQGEDEVKFETIDDLDKSGLIPYIRPIDFAINSDLFAGPLKHLEPDLVTNDTEHWDCLNQILQFGNVTCFMSRAFAEKMIGIYTNLDQFQIKIAQPCFSTEPLSMMVGKRSPYRSRLDKIILRLHSSGLAKKRIPLSYGAFPWNVERALGEGLEDQDTVRNQLIAIAIVGYSFSLIVFFIEIIYHRISMYVQSKIRPFTL